MEENFPARVANILERSGLPPEVLELEITESLLVKDEALAVLLKLKAVGVSLALDDFGTGYSNLKAIRESPIDRLKIDRGFVSCSADDQQARAITAAILAMADGLHVKVVAEGVETAEQHTYFKGCRCDEVQGFFYSRPLNADSAENFLLEKTRVNEQDPGSTTVTEALTIEGDCADSPGPSLEAPLKIAEPDCPNEPCG
ncbi:MAG: Phytochrome-like protein cph2 [Deltaproteobacteria bacterium ADurb.Bin510]|nr:MAG: Phytochrome-like protein cph2 [Deltaproteobacteria bacterium ADurb.Bin510]